MQMEAYMEALASFQQQQQKQLVLMDVEAEENREATAALALLACRRAELEQIIAMYAGEEFAESSKELVIERSRRGVEQAERSMALQRAERERLESVDLPRAALKKQRALDAAKLKWMGAERRLKMERESIQTKRLEVLESVRKAEEALAKARDKAGVAAAEEETEELQALGYLDMEQE
jgi:hypothetical protein